VTVNLLYFAALRDVLGRAEEQLVGEFTNLQQLREHLALRGGEWQRLVGGTTLAAINQEMAHNDSPLNDGDEVAFFPPVTGG
jgi:molybdopterin synthase sulfur carrier subunit